MSNEKSTAFALIFFAVAVMCVWNPDAFPARDWLNACLAGVFGWAH